MNVSVYKNIKCSRNPIGCQSIEDILFSNKVRPQVDQLRQLKKGTPEFSVAKATLPCFTPSGIFNVRHSGGLIQHSGLLCLDFDNVDNTEFLKEILRKQSFVFYAGLSCSGHGLYALVRISKPENHKGHFIALSKYFAELGFEVDQSGSDICRLRVASYDDNQIFNPYAVEWNIVDNVGNISLVLSKSENDIKLFMAGLQYIEQNSIDVTEDRNRWLALGSMIKTMFGISGKDYFIRLSRFYPGFSEIECSTTFDSLHTGNYNIGIFASACNDAGIPKLKYLL